MTSLMRRSRQQVRRLSAGLAARLPADAGPERWTSFVVRTRVRRATRLLATDPRAALDLLGPVLETDADPAAWLVAARAHERLGDAALANKMADRAVAGGRGTLSALQERRRLAVRTGFAEHSSTTLEAIAATRPTSAAELATAVKELRQAPRELLERFAATVGQVGPGGEGTEAHEAAQELLDEDALVTAHEQDHATFESLTEQVLSSRTHPVAVVTRALVRCRAWQEAADFVCVTPGSQRVGPQASGAFPTRDVVDAATRALRAGHPTPAAMLAARALAASPRSRTAQETFTAAHDQIRIVRNGWTFPPRAAAPAYPVDQTSALAVLSQSLPHTSGGYATRTHGILTGLAARGRHLEAVTRLGFPYDRWSGSDRTVAPYDDVDGIRYHRLLDDRRRYPQHPLTDYVEETAAGIERLARNQRAGLIHASSFYVAGMAGLTAARRLGVPFIYEMRGLEELMKVSRDPDFAGSGREAFLQLLETQVAAEADAALIITQALRDEMVRRGVREDRAFVVPNGVHTSMFRPMERDVELERRLGVTGRTVIGYVGGLVDYEGVDLLMDAVSRLRGRRPDDFRVLIVGDGPFERSVREAAVRGGVLDIVTFTGRVPHAEVNRYLSLVDIAPFPRLPLPVCELISPIKPFESMAMGKAVVASDVAALAEIVDDGRTGHLFRKGDADHLATVLETLIDHPDHRRVVGEAARQWVVAERDWDRITGVVDEVYAEVLQRRGGS
ncbi:glycosyltransferase family 4 protein [Ornithinimicrobium sp. W1679]|uniref:glycosyltransferase family 4 protein n=1 Tax=unclassified Ornithinimicrobium TaxID=2615080 RepID=UPI003CF7B138